MKKIYILGDLHGRWDYLNTFINKKNPAIILQCGDFGYWPILDGKDERSAVERLMKKRPKLWKLAGIKNKCQNGDFCDVHWVDGNHEDHWSLRDLDSDEIQPHVYYQRRGTVLTLPDGRNVLFMGGADSIDQAQRTYGYDWFPEELITYSDMTNLPDCRIDIIISHTCPKEFDPLPNRHSYSKLHDPSREALSQLLERYRPDLWYFGHWHKNISSKYNNTYWHCLNMANHTGWWIQLPEV